MTWGTAIVVAAGFGVPVIMVLVVALQYLAQHRDIRKCEARDERRCREAEVEHAIARRRERERAGPAETLDAPGV